MHACMARSLLMISSDDVEFLRRLNGRHWLFSALRRMKVSERCKFVPKATSQVAFGTNYLQLHVLVLHATALYLQPFSRRMYYRVVYVYTMYSRGGAVDGPTATACAVSKQGSTQCSHSRGRPRLALTGRRRRLTLHNLVPFQHVLRGHDRAVLLRLMLVVRLPTGERRERRDPREDAGRFESSSRQFGCMTAALPTSIGRFPRVIVRDGRTRTAGTPRASP